MTVSGRAFLTAVLASLCAAATILSQEQQPSSRLGWPCAGRPDPTYFKLAEATGGQFFLFHPSEVGESGALMAAAMSHKETLFRAGGMLAAGLHEFSVPVDDVESVLFSVSVQCLDLVEIARPSGAVLQAADAGVDYHQFEAGRIITVPHPEAGSWRIRASGSRLFLFVVQAKSGLHVGAPEFVPTGPPREGVTQTVRFTVDEGIADVQARLVTQAFEDIAVVPLRRPDQADGPALVGEITPPARPFRFVVTGRTAEGLVFQRVHPPLFELGAAPGRQ